LEAGGPLIGRAATLSPLVEEQTARRQELVEIVEIAKVIAAPCETLLILFQLSGCSQKDGG
jgi:hypothetical protein